MADDETGRITAFFAREDRWKNERAAFRAILKDAPLIEEWKWRSPCYTYEGKAVLAVWGLSDRCVLSFFKGVLLDDPAGILTAPGENSRSVRVVAVTGVDEIEAMRDTVAAYVAEAIANEAAGREVTFDEGDPDWPDELSSATDDDPEFRAAFEALTPGRRRGYIVHFAGAKKSETRERRIEKHRARILDGKGMHDR